MNELEAYLARARTSDYFGGTRLPDVLRSFMGDHEPTLTELGLAGAARVDQLFLVGSGGSLANLLTAKYVLDRILQIPSDVVPSYELLWRDPRRLTERSLVLLASLSGETEDTVAAQRFARSRGARTVVLVGRPESRLAAEADEVVPYGAAFACYEAPLIAALVIGIALGSRTAKSELGNELLAGLHALPDTIGRVVAAEELRAEAKAREFMGSSHVYVLGAGPLSALAYKLAMSVVMENVRIGATYSDAVEFRHGPAEALERIRPDFIFLLGTDESRDLTLRTMEFCRPRASRFLAYDAAEFGDVHPLLTPLVMNSVTQWLIVYSALLRGILDLDERVFMGHGVLASGDSAWP
jgi:fructoselysine 6-phosphate deglycase